MRLHFAAELVFKIICQKFNSPQKTGSNITDKKARIDLCRKGNISEIFYETEKELAQIVMLNKPIISAFENKDPRAAIGK